MSMREIMESMREGKTVHPFLTSEPPEFQPEIPDETIEEEPEVSYGSE